MSSPIDQRKTFDDNGKPNMSFHSESGCFENVENSTSQPSGIYFNSLNVECQPRDKDGCKNENCLTEPVMQEISKLRTNEIGVLNENKISDSTILLDSRSNGEGCSDNKNIFRADGMLQPRVEVEVTRHYENLKGNSSHCSNNYGKDLLNVKKSGKSDIQLQPEILLQPNSLQSESSRSPQPSSRGELGINVASSMCVKNPADTKTYSSSTGQHGKINFGADNPSSVHFIKTTGSEKPSGFPAKQDIVDVGTDFPSSVTKPTDTRKHSSSTVNHNKVEPQTDKPSKACSTKSTSIKTYSTQTAQLSRTKPGVDPSVHFKKPIGSRQHSNPTSDRGRENRDKLEAGELSRHSSVRCEEIENLPLGESPEPQVVISPSCSDELQVNLCELVFGFCWRWYELIKQRTCRQFTKAPFFYLFSTLVITTSIISWDNASTNQDIPATIFFSFSTFVLITFFIDRGQFSHVLGGWKTCIRECRRGCGSSDACIPLCCCRSPEPRFERHSQYRHLEEDGAFKHEIADVSNIDPKDCPQIKMVELKENEHADSPDHPCEVSQVNADVHVGKRDGEKLRAARRHLSGTIDRTTKPHKVQSEKTRPKPAKTFRVNIHSSDYAKNELSPPELSPIPENRIRNGEEHLDNSEEIGSMEEGFTSRTLVDASTGDDNLSENDFSDTDSPIFPGGGKFMKFPDGTILPRFESMPSFTDNRQSINFSDCSRIQCETKEAVTPSKKLEDSSKCLEDLGEYAFSKATVDSPRLSGRDEFQKFADCSPTLSRFSNFRPLDSSSDCSQGDSGRSTSPEDESFPVDEVEVHPVAEEFICEHYGQSVACSCPTFLKRRVESMR